MSSCCFWASLTWAALFTPVTVSTVATGVPSMFTFADSAFTFSMAVWMPGYMARMAVICSMEAAPEGPVSPKSSAIFRA